MQSESFIHRMYAAEFRKHTEKTTKSMTMRSAGRDMLGDFREVLAKNRTEVRGTMREYSRGLNTLFTRFRRDTQRVQRMQAEGLRREMTLVRQQEGRQWRDREGKLKKYVGQAKKQIDATVPEYGKGIQSSISTGVKKGVDEATKHLSKLTGVGGSSGGGGSASGGGTSFIPILGGAKGGHIGLAIAAMGHLMNQAKKVADESERLFEGMSQQMMLQMGRTFHEAYQLELEMVRGIATEYNELLGDRRVRMDEIREANQKALDLGIKDLNVLRDMTEFLTISSKVMPSVDFSGLEMTKEVIGSFQDGHKAMEELLVTSRRLSQEFWVDPQTLFKVQNNFHRFVRATSVDKERYVRIMRDLQTSVAALEDSFIDAEKMFSDIQTMALKPLTEATEDIKQLAFLGLDPITFRHMGLTDPSKAGDAYMEAIRKRFAPYFEGGVFSGGPMEAERLRIMVQAFGFDLGFIMDVMAAKAADYEGALQKAEKVQKDIVDVNQELVDIMSNEVWHNMLAEIKETKDQFIHFNPLLVRLNELLAKNDLTLGNILIMGGMATYIIKNLGGVLSKIGGFFGIKGLPALFGKGAAGAAGAAGKGLTAPAWALGGKGVAGAVAGSAALPVTASLLAGYGIHHLVTKDMTEEEKKELNRNMRSGFSVNTSDLVGDIESGMYDPMKNMDKNMEEMTEEGTSLFKRMKGFFSGTGGVGGPVGVMGSGVGAGPRGLDFSGSGFEGVNSWRGHRMFPSMGYHTGIDLSTGGKKIDLKSNIAGMVENVGYDKNLGNYLMLKDIDGKYHLYGHLDKRSSLRDGDIVLPGQKMGVVGSTGMSTGNHLHYEVRSGRGYGTDVDPLGWLGGFGVRGRGVNQRSMGELFYEGLHMIAEKEGLVQETGTDKTFRTDGIPGVDGSIVGKDNFLGKLAPIFREVALRNNLLPSVMIAQAAQETGWGRSTIGEANNLFGIKARSGDPYVTKRTHEYVNGKKVWIDANFRKYESYADSIYDYAVRLMQNSRYDRVRSASDYKDAARALQEAGYATDPNYSKALISIIESNKLYELDRGGIGGGGFSESRVFRDKRAGFGDTRGVMGPAFGAITSPFGWRNSGFHHGIDYRASVGTPVPSTTYGKVYDVANHPDGYGKLVRVKDLSGYGHIYAHLSKQSVSVGDMVMPGTILGLSGNTGRSTGPHLHYEVRKDPWDRNTSIDPSLWVARRGEIRDPNRYTGYPFSGTSASMPYDGIIGAWHEMSAHRYPFSGTNPADWVQDSGIVGPWHDWSMHMSEREMSPAVAGWFSRTSSGSGLTGKSFEDLDSYVAEARKASEDRITQVTGKSGIQAIPAYRSIASGWENAHSGVSKMGDVVTPALVALGILRAKEDWVAAMGIGDELAMRRAHKAAEDFRAEAVRKGLPSILYNRNTSSAELRKIVSGDWGVGSYLFKANLLDEAMGMNAPALIRGILQAKDMWRLSDSINDAEGKERAHRSAETYRIAAERQGFSRSIYDRSASSSELAALLESKSSKEISAVLPPNTGGGGSGEIVKTLVWTVGRLEGKLDELKSNIDEKEALYSYYRTKSRTGTGSVIYD